MFTSVSLRDGACSLRMCRVIIKYRLAWGAGLLQHFLPWFVTEASLKSYSYSASKNMFIELLLLRDSVLCNFEFEFCVLSHFQRRGLTSVYALILKIEKCIAYAISCTLYKLWWHSYIVKDTLMITWPVGKPAVCFMHADYIEILNVYMFDLFSSRAILLHSYFCKICVLRRIKTLLYYVFVMDSLYCSLYKAGVF